MTLPFPIQSIREAALNGFADVSLSPVGAGALYSASPKMDLVA